MGFSSSLMAYVGTIGSIGSTFGIWIFKRCKIVITFSIRVLSVSLTQKLSPFQTS